MFLFHRDGSIQSNHPRSHVNRLEPLQNNVLMVVRLHTPHLILLVERSLVQEGLRRFNAVERDECVIHMSSGWFDCTEPSVRTYSQGKRGIFLRGLRFLPLYPTSYTSLHSYSHHSHTRTVARTSLSTLGKKP